MVPRSAGAEGDASLHGHRAAIPGSDWAMPGRQNAIAALDRIARVGGRQGEPDIRARLIASPLLAN